jgi:hypothetical protein
MTIKLELTKQVAPIKLANANFAYVASPATSPTLSTAAVSALFEYSNTEQMLGNVATAYGNSVAFSVVVSNQAYTNAIFVANTLAGTAYANAVAYVDGKDYVNTSQLVASTNSAYSNAIVYADIVANQAYSNSILIANSLANSAYSNAIFIANTLASEAYSNSVLVANSLATTAYSNAIVFAANVANQAYSNAIIYSDLAANTAYSNSVAYTDIKSSNAYTNAIVFASNATNISTGTLSNDRLPANIVFTTVNTNVLNVGSNISVNTTSLSLDNIAIRVNSTVGVNGQILTSNGTVAYWANPEAGFSNGQSIAVQDLVVNGAFTANGSNGAAGQVLSSNGTGVYWANTSSGVGETLNTFLLMGA